MNWVPVPSTEAAVSNVMVIELMCLLSLSAMLIALTEKVLEYGVWLITQYTRSRSKMEEAVMLYFTKAVQEVNIEMESYKVEKAQYMEVLAKMNQMLTLELEKANQAKQVVSSVTSGDSCGSVTPVEESPREKAHPPPVSEQGDSQRSVALTSKAG